jgi:cellobiose phosphorylase
VLDLVFINDTTGNERDQLAHFIRNMADTERLWLNHQSDGKVFILNGSDISDAERTLLRTVARLTFNTADGLTIQQQLEQLEAVNQQYQDKVEYPVLRPKKEFRVWSSLDFYNQYGGFDRNGRDYVVTNTNTPMPWINVIANEHHFGCIVSSTMAGFTFAYNAQQFKLTGWSNDIVRDNASEMLLIDKQQFLPATARHGQGWSAFDADYDEIKVNVRLFVAIDKMEKYYQIKVENKNDTSKQLMLDMVYKLVMGTSEEDTARYLYSEWNQAANTLCVRNVYHPIYKDRTLFLTATEPLNDISLNYPNRKRLGMVIEIPANGEKEVAFVISCGNVETTESATTGISTPQHISISTINDEFDRVVAFWDKKLDFIQVETPDRSFNYMLNRWYLYQVYTSRLFARAGFYQVGGATGFRDQLQDVMSILYSDPAYARRQILDHAAHQFAEGDVLHWWHESIKLGARTTFSDDYLWLIFVTYQYVSVTGDSDILLEKVPFCQAEPLAPGEAERGIHYECGESKENATLYEHLRRAMNRAMSRIGAHGLPLMGCGDWNDGMSAVGIGGKGESVWVAFFIADLTPKLQQLTQMLPDADLAYCEELQAFHNSIVHAIQHSAWDGAWFLRAYYDNGDPMGSRNNTECQIDLISQAWSILTDVATPEQKNSIMRETDNRLVNREHEIIQLLTPAFRNSQPSPGYIMNYPVGVRENGGQYTHGAMWYIMAQLKEGRYDMAYFLYSLINPIHRTQTLADVLKYKVEPYCIAADIYSTPQHPGRGGWTWYTGSASWAYKTGIENILGLHKTGKRLTLHPRVPTEWQNFTIRYRYRTSRYIIKYSRTNTPTTPTAINLVDDGREHIIEIH